MARRPTGVYDQIDPIPVSESASVSAIPLIYMRTVKGDRITKLSATDWKDKVGFDLAFNPLYANLARLFEFADSAYLVRIWKEAYLANALVFEDGDVGNANNVETFDELMTSSASFSDDFKVQVGLNKFTLKQAPVLGSVKILVGGVEVGTVGASGSIVSDFFTGSITGAELSIEATGETYTPPVDITVNYITASTAVLIVAANSVGNYLDGSVKVTNNGDGTVTAVYTSATGSTSTVSGDVGAIVKGDDITVYATTAFTGEANITALGGGSAGQVPDSLPNFADYATIAGTPISWTFTLTAGLQGDMLRKVLVESAKLKKACLYGSPFFTKFADLSNWKSVLTGTYDFSSFVWTTEFIQLNATEYVVDGSITRFSAYASMWKNRQTIFQVPAGKTYGTLSGYRYAPTDAEDHLEELVLLRAGWVKFRPAPTLWDQWTDSTQSDLHPLSYLNSAVVTLVVRDNLKTILESNLYLLDQPTVGASIDSVISVQATTYLQSVANDGYMTGFTVTVSKTENRTRKIVAQIVPAEDLEVVDLVIQV